MGRHTNQLLQFLLDNPQAKNDFIELMNRSGSAKDLYYYFEENKFYGEKYFLSGQTIRNIIKRLGFSGRRGRPSKRYDQQRYKIK